MSSTTPSRSHVLPWCLGALLLPPLLYALSVPAVLRSVGLKVHPQDLRYYKKAPQWVQNYCIPYNQALSSDTPLKKPLEAYANLWGYKRHPFTVRSEESTRKTAELRAKFDEIRENMEKKLGRPLEFKTPRPPFPPPHRYLDPILDAAPPATPRGGAGSSPRKSP
jgi:hypothetical protein